MPDSQTFQPGKAVLISIVYEGFQPIPNRQIPRMTDVIQSFLKDLAGDGYDTFIFLNYDFFALEAMKFLTRNKRSYTNLRTVGANETDRINYLVKNCRAWICYCTAEGKRTALYKQGRNFGMKILNLHDWFPKRKKRTYEKSE